MLGLLAAVALAPALSLSQSLGLPREPDKAASDQGNIVNGRFVTIGGLYGHLRIDCVRCHGLDGSGNSSGAFPRLTDQSAWYLYKTLQDYAAGLRPSEIMQPIANVLSVTERRDVAAYYASVKDAPYPPKSAIDVQTLQRGGAIAAVGIPGQGVPACNGCHGPHGIGQAPMYPYLAGQFARYLRDQLMLWKKGRRQGDPMNIMEIIAKAMTEEQIEAVSLYYASVRPDEVTPNDRGAASPTAPRKGVQPPDMGAVRTPQPKRDAVVVPGKEPAANSPGASQSGAARGQPSNTTPPYLPGAPLKTNGGNTAPARQ
jgi:cytochrome c553